jgi:hypothetical protein
MWGAPAVIGQVASRFSNNVFYSTIQNLIKRCTENRNGTYSYLNTYVCHNDILTSYISSRAITGLVS